MRTREYAALRARLPSMSKIALLEAALALGATANASKSRGGLEAYLHRVLSSAITHRMIERGARRAGAKRRN